MPTVTEVHRLAAFTDDPAGGNPAGVVLTDAPLPAADMQRIAADVGYSETAFLTPAGEPRAYRVRYFAPDAEVPFCGHATVAAGVELGRRHGEGTYQLETVGGRVPVDVSRGADGAVRATLTSLPPRVEAADDALLEGALAALRWSPELLDPRFPPAVSYAGARHLLLVAADRSTLAALDYDFAALLDVMRSADLTTVALLWEETPERFHARNAFPVGGVVEDPATGAAAAAFGGYLRHHGFVDPPMTLTIQQGDDMGRPSTITVHVPRGAGGIEVSGTAVAIPD